MGKVAAATIGAIIGGFVAVKAIVFWFGWGLPRQGQVAHIDPTRADYVDLLLTVATILLGATGLAVTVGALVIGLVALKTLREIKDEAKDAAAEKINEIMAAELKPSVDGKVKETLPIALRAALAEEDTGLKIMTDLARTGALDDVVERVMEQISSGVPVTNPADVVEGGDQD